MHIEAIHEAEAAPALPSFTIDGATLAKALKILAPHAVKAPSYAGKTDGRHCVLIEAGTDGLRLTVSDLETVASICLPADVASPGRCAVPAAGLCDASRKLPKGSQATFGTREGRGLLTAGRARFTVTLCDVETFPTFPLAGIAPAEAWELAGDDPAALGDGRAEGLVISEAAAKVIAKAVKRAEPTAKAKKAGAEVPAAQLTRFEPAEPIGSNGWQNRNPRLVIEIGDMIVTAQLTEPERGFWRAKRNPYTFGPNGERQAKAATYARHLRDTYGLPAVEEAEGRLVYNDGLALGMTFGEPFWDSSEYRPAPEFTPPAGTEIVHEGSAFEECEVDGTRYSRMGGGEWQRWYVGTNALTYPAGAYSVFFPRADRPVISEVIVEAEGVEYPVGTNSSGFINLTAERIAELVGPVDEIERVAIPTLRMFQGELLPAGTFLPTPRRISDRDAARMTAEEMRAYCEACRPIIMPPPAEIAEDVEPAPAVAVCEIAQTRVAEPEPDLSPPVQPVISTPAAAPAATEAPAGSLASEARPAPADEDLRAMVAQLASRVAVLEGGQPAPAEPTSVRQLPRELRLRIVGRYLAMRAQRALDVAALLASRDYLAKVETAHATALEHANAMRIDQVRGYSDTLRTVEAESTRRNAAALAAEARATVAESELVTLRRRIDIAEGARAVAEGRQATLTTENASLRRQIAENTEGAGWERIRAAAALADQAGEERAGGVIILTTSRQPARV